MSDVARECAIEVEVRPDGTGRVVVDGKDISNRVSAIEVVAMAGKTPTVTLVMRAVEVRVMGSALVSHKMLVLDPDTATEATAEGEVSG